MQVLLLGGHGKVALYMTPLLLNRAWNVTSVVRNPAHESEILELGKGRKGKVNVLVSSLDEVKSAADARKILDSVTPDYVIWSAGMLVPLPPLKFRGTGLGDILHIPFASIFNSNPTKCLY